MYATNIYLFNMTRTRSIYLCNNYLFIYLFIYMYIYLFNQLYLLIYSYLMKCGLAFWRQHLYNRPGIAVAVLQTPLFLSLQLTWAGWGPCRHYATYIG